MINENLEKLKENMEKCAVILKLIEEGKQEMFYQLTFFGKIAPKMF